MAEARQKPDSLQERQDRMFFEAANPEWVAGDERKKFRREPQKLEPGEEREELKFDYKERNPRVVSIEELIGTEEEPGEAGDLVFESIKNKQELEKLINRASLNPKQKQALQLRYFEGMKSKEIGEEMGLSKERIRQILAKAIRRIRCQFKNIKNTKKSR